MKEIHDHYFHRAKKDWYVARSAYKLQEIDQKFKFFWPQTQIVIDIGCSPWSWLQYTSRQFKRYHKKSSNAKIIGFDLKPVSLSLPFVTTFQQDITDQQAVREIINSELSINNWNNNSSLLTSDSSLVDVIISDMAPDTTSDKWRDALISSQLIMDTMRMYEQYLDDNWKFAIKIFMWPGFEELIHYCRSQRWHKSIKLFKPKACRKESKETYIVKI